MAPMVTNNQPSTSKFEVSEDVVSERHLRKRLAARVRQQRCRARKREAKLAKTQRNVKAPRPTAQHQIVRGPVLIRSPPPHISPRMSMTLMHHPTSPFIMYPRRSAPFATPGAPPPPTMYSPPPPPPPIGMGNGAFHRRRPMHKDIMSESVLALSMSRSPVMRRPPPLVSPPHPSTTAMPHTRLFIPHIPRVSPVDQSNKKFGMVPLLPDLVVDRLERKEETAIDAMLSLHRSPSKTEA
ncbi:expressed unknown protein [Seminavis robusta]|uniref:Uncharacterized protein n=1 Tax=Seminavis robusta TaxID=568900 RepID=A0A9N8DBB4_9STRA|nr:expressed unknown protein [Seminavis robusta]|eukprot:Sro70_g039070.1 n/a (239) ;mRNA; f:106635-107351